MTEARTHPPGELDWLLDDLVGQVRAVRCAMVLSADGLPLAASAALSREDGEHLAAVASGLHSLAKGTSRHFETGGVRQTMIEFEQGFLFVMAAGAGAGLAVFSDADADIGLIAYEMARLVRRVGEHLSAPPRAPRPPHPQPQPQSQSPSSAQAQPPRPRTGAASTP